MSQAPFTLPDQKARDEIIGYPGHTFVTAGAGAGKSTTLARKIVHLITTGSVDEINQVAAITFTRKAAAELKWKIEEEIENALKTPSLERAPKERLEKALYQLEDSIIGTIHSFCSEVLRRYALYVGIDPAFSINDENQSKIHMEEFFEQYIRLYWYSDKKSATNEIFKTWKSIFFFQPSINIPTFLEYFARFHEKYYLIEKQPPESFAIADEKNLQEMTQTLFQEHRDNFLKLISHYDCSGDAPDSLGARILEFVPRLKEAKTWEELYDLPPEVSPGRKLGSKKLIAQDSPYGADTTKLIRTYFNFLLTQESAEFQKKAAGLAGYPEVAKSSLFSNGEFHSLSGQVLTIEYLRKLWFDACSHFELKYSEYKKQKSLLDYQDLVYLTERVLANEEAKANLQKKIAFLFVDEYQDTDPLQTQIFKALCTGSKKQKDTPTTLFRVGDEKQSIYLFRGADLETFHHEKKSFLQKKDGLCASLITNMRSYPEIVHFVNALFAPNEKPHELDLPGYTRMEALNRPEGSPPGAGVYLPRIDNYDKEEKARGRRRAEAAWMAAEIARLKKSHPQVSMGLLFYTLSSIDLYIKELEKLDIPYRLYGRKYYGENDLRRYLILLLRVIANPHDQLAYGGLLRSPFGGLKDAKAHELLYSKKVTPPKDTAIKSELAQNLDQTLNKARMIARSRPLAHLLWFLYDKYALFFLESASSRAYRESLWGALQKAGFLDQQNEPQGVAKIDFLIEYLSELEHINVESGGEESDFESDRLQIMTYHKSKGLEFDFLFLGDLAYGSGPQSEDFMIEKIDKEHRFYYKGDLGNYHTRAPSPVELGKQKTNEEKTRLLYVAMTRAKERLYLPLLRPERAAHRTFFEKLENTLEQKLGLSLELWGGSEQWKDHEPAGLKAVYTATLNEPINASPPAPLLKESPAKPWQLPPAQKNRAAGHYSFFSGTSLSKKRQALFGHDKNQAIDEPELEKTGDFTEEMPVRRSFLPPKPDTWESLDALARGIIIHAIFEWVDLKNPQWDKHKTQALLYSNDLPAAMELELERIARETLDIYQKSELFTLVSRCQITGKETGFSILKHPEQKERHLGIGYIDLILETNEQDEMIIVDYKTNATGNLSWAEFENKMLGSYEIPMSLYRETLAASFPGKKVSLCLYHTPSGKTIFYKNPEKLPAIDSLPELFTH